MATTELPIEQEYKALLSACANYKRRAEAAEAAIAAAVQAEREACAKIAYGIATEADERNFKRGAQAAAAAIRARGNGSK